MGTGEYRVQTPWEAGRSIARRYLLERLLGGGAMGEVWLAEDTVLRKPVALKVLQPDVAQKRDTVRRFLREVALAHSVTHPHVVRIYDTGEEDGLPFFAMEYLQGKTLEELLGDGQGEPAERLEFDEIRRIAFDVLDAMDAAHRAGVIHRDLKPGNVMLTHRGAIVMDFGVAGIEEAPTGKPTAETIRALIKTEAGTIFGSPAYMPPELWEGAPASVQSDLYAFGVMLYQMITGRLPFRAKTPAGYLQQLSAGRPPPIRSYRRSTPWYLVRLVRMCMAARREDRPTSAAAAANILAPLRAKNRRVVVMGLAAVGAVAAGIAIWNDADSYRSRGLPDRQAEMDLSAAVRSYDVGDTEAGLRQLDRVARRAPGSACVSFWRSTMLHELGDEVGRMRACEELERNGSDAWQRLAEGACESTFRIADPALRELEDPGSTRTPEVLPLAVRWDLVPRVEVSTDENAQAREEARQILEALSEPGDAPPRWRLDARRQLARVDLELSLGRIEEAGQRLTALTDEHPEIPIYARHAAWLASRVGNEDRARALAQRVRPIDETAWALQAMAAGRMKEVWATIEPLSGTAAGEGLRTAWCGYAHRFAVHPTPSQCQDLPPSLVASLSGAETPAPPLLGASVVGAAEASAAGRCPGKGKGEGDGDSDGETRPAVVLTHAAPPFELYRAELELEAALTGCDGGEPDLAVAQELASRLGAVGQTDPWVLLLLGRLAEARGEERDAHARRLAALERWRGADPDLPAVAELFRTMKADLPDGPRTAALP